MDPVGVYQLFFLAGLLIVSYLWLVKLESRSVLRRLVSGNKAVGTLSAARIPNLT